jgi:integrating conjugative element protein (TIGR03759 family)
MRRTSLSLALVLCALYLSGLHAQEPAHLTPATVSPNSATQLRPASERDLSAQSAREWGLTREEWARYSQLMRGPLGIYSPNLDPLTALGTEARSDSERRHIAELQVRMEAQRVEKLLAYQRAYDAAWKRTYPALLPFQGPAPGAIPSNTALISAALPGAAPTRSTGQMTAAPPARLAVFVKEDCPACDQRVKDLERSGEPFDLYMVGTRGDDARIRTWATRLKIDPAKVRAGTITLNHDAGRWFSIGLPGSLPAVLHSVSGQWVRE